MEAIAGPFCGIGRRGVPAATAMLAASNRPDVSVYHHLVLAAEDLANRPGMTAPADRLLAAAARFRDLAHRPGCEALEPVVRLSNGLTVPVSGLMEAAWLRYRGSFPGQWVDAEMVEAARQLLAEVVWVLPTA